MTVFAPGLASLLDARIQMGFTLAVHIVIAALGVGFPVLMLVAERRWLSTGDRGWRALARRWSEAFAVLFAVGAVTGTVLSFELGLLWPGFLGTFGSVIGLPFTLEAYAFFLEAIFLGIYLYGWDRLTPRAHWWSGVPVAVAGLASAVFVVAGNAWMNAPRGFTLSGGRVVDVEPIVAMANAAAPAQVVHMALAAYVVTGFLVAAVYARAMLRGRDDEHVRRGLSLGLALGAGLVPVQALVGHWSGTVVAATQPVKLAALEGQWETQARAPLRIGGIPDADAETTRYAIEIPGGLSFLAHADPDSVVRGLKEVPRENRPPVAAVHLSFQAMLGAGAALIAIAAWAGWRRWRRRGAPPSRAFLRAVLVGGPLAIVALEAGWLVTELGRQPWIVQGVMRVRDAVTDAPGTRVILAASIAIYAMLAVGGVVVLGRLARRPIGSREGGA